MLAEPLLQYFPSSMRALRQIAAILLLVPQAFADDTNKRPLGVPEDATLFQGNWYRVYLGNMCWRSAEARCAQLGGRLVVIPNQKTQDFLAKLANGRSMWIGATNERTNGVWVWSDGSKMTFSAWMRGQPSGFKSKEFYAVMGKKNGNWFDIDAASDLVEGYFCEWPQKK
jgi:hypothetical protein